MKLQYFTVNAFTDTAFQGTQVLVFPDADSADDATMTAINEEFGFPDTVFVKSGSSPDYAAKLRLFTRSGEIAFAGHATIGAAYALFHGGKFVSQGLPFQCTLEEGVGPVDLIFRKNDDSGPVTEFVVKTNPVFETYVPPTEDLAKILGIEHSSFAVDTFSPLVTLCDRPYLIIPVCETHALQQAKFNYAAWVQSSATSTMPTDLFVFSPTSADSTSHFQGRLLGQSIGMEDDPPIGSVMPAFANYLIQCDGSFISKEIVVQRGRGHKRLSTLKLRIDINANDTTSVRVGGSAVVVSRGELSIP